MKHFFLSLSVPRAIKNSLRAHHDVFVFWRRTIKQRTVGWRRFSFHTEWFLIVCCSLIYGSTGRSVIYGRRNNIDGAFTIWKRPFVDCAQLLSISEFLSWRCIFLRLITWWNVWVELAISPVSPRFDAVLFTPQAIEESFTEQARHNDH